MRVMNVRARIWATLGQPSREARYIVMGMSRRLRKAVFAERRPQIGDAFVRADACISDRQRAVNFDAPIHTAIAM